MVVHKANASGEKYHQAVVKHIPSPPASAQNPAGSHWKGNPVGCWMQQVPAMAGTPQAGKCWSSQEQENIPQVVGVFILFFILFSLPAAHTELVVGLLPAL